MRDREKTERQKDMLIIRDSEAVRDVESRQRERERECVCVYEREREREECKN